MRPLLVLSVPHTGTMFTLDLLPGRRGQWPGPFESGCKYTCHLTDPDAGIARNECFTIVPLRDYAAVQRSWVRRGMDLLDLARQWSEVTALKDVFYLPIDREDRDERLAHLSAALGTSLTTDWKPSNQLPGVLDPLAFPRLIGAAQCIPDTQYQRLDDGHGVIHGY